VLPYGALQAQSFHTPATEFRVDHGRRRAACDVGGFRARQFDGEFGKGPQTYAGSATVRYTW